MKLLEIGRRYSYAQTLQPMHFLRRYSSRSGQTYNLMHNGRRCNGWSESWFNQSWFCWHVLSAACFVYNTLISIQLYKQRISVVYSLVFASKHPQQRTDIETTRNTILRQYNLLCIQSILFNNRQQVLEAKGCKRKRNFALQQFCLWLILLLRIPNVDERTELRLERIFNFTLLHGCVLAIVTCIIYWDWAQLTEYGSCELNWSKTN